MLGRSWITVSGSTVFRASRLSDCRPACSHAGDQGRFAGKRDFVTNEQWLPGQQNPSPVSLQSRPAFHLGLFGLFYYLIIHQE